MADLKPETVPELTSPVATAKYTQDNFVGGINRLLDPTMLGVGEYALLVNGRIRNGGIEPVKLPTEVKGIPAGLLKQGIYAANNYLLLFQDGQAFLKDCTPTNKGGFNPVAGFQMDRLIPYIYAELVPASYKNFQRKLTTTSKASAILLEATVASTPVAVVCQDGINQPQLIFNDGSTRVSYTYDDWSNTATGIREYIPIGKQMMYQDGILYVIAKDSSGKYTQILRSVTGRPLDFVVNVDNSGAKAGDASTVAYAVDFSDVTCIKAVGASEGSFLVTTFKNSYLVTPDRTNTMFGEPTFYNQSLFSTGAVNQFSVTSVSGDTALIDFYGIRSFNSILQAKNEGRNLPFSSSIQRILGEIIQTTAAAVEFDNYNLFAVSTIYGPGILVYDNLLGKWISLDLYGSTFGTGVGIKQFAAINTSTIKALFCITTDNKCYQLFSSSSVAQCGFYCGEWAPNAEGKEQKPLSLNLVFTDVKESGTVSAQCYLDNLLEETLSDTVTQTALSSPDVDGTTSLPFGNASRDTVRNKSLDLRNVQYGYKTGFYIQWNFQAKLISIAYEADVRDAQNSAKEQARDYISLLANR